MSRNSTWANPDGLQVGFGPHTLDTNIPRVIAGPGHIKTLTLEITGVGLTATAPAITDFPAQASKIKRGSRIISAAFVPTVGFTGAAAVLNIGTYKDTSDVAVAADVSNGIMTAANGALANLTLGAVQVCSGTLVNGSIVAGATSDSDVYIGVFTTGAAFTAGVGTLTISYVEPLYNVATFANDNVGPAF